MKMICAGAFLLFLMAGSAVAQIAPDPWYSAHLSYDEASEMLCQTLALAISRYGVADRNFLEDEHNIPLLDEGVEYLPVPAFGDTRFVLTDRDQLQAAADAHGAYLYHFRIVSVVRDGDAVLVGLDNIPQYARDPAYHMFGAGIRVRFTRIGAQWHGVTNGMWVE
jgi:hypothetical protein